MPEHRKPRELMKALLKVDFDKSPKFLQALEETGRLELVNILDPEGTNTLVVLYLYHAIHYLRYSVIGDNSILHNFVFLGPIITKFGVVDYVGTPYSEADVS